MKQKIKVDRNGWCRCGRCGHKLFRLGNIQMDKRLVLVELEIKCHSCKEINTFFDDGEKEE